MDKEKHGPSIFVDGEPVQSSNLIFDETYKNAYSKKKYYKKRQYAYFNTLMKMKARLQNKDEPGLHDRAEIYNHVFNQNDNLQHVSEPVFTNPKPNIFHVEKLNKNIYKIQKLDKLEEMNHQNVRFNLQFQTTSGSINKNC